MKEMATMPRPTTTIIFLEVSLIPGPGLPSTGSPCRSPSKSGMTGYWSTEDEHPTKYGQDYILRELHMEATDLAKGDTRGEHITKTSRV